MATKYYALLTNVGAAKLANATALGEQVEITQMAVGDGNGALPTPNPAQTALVHELRRAPLNTLTIDPVNTNQIIAEQVIPEDVGGWWIREIGLYDSDGDMIAVANCAETYKPLLQEGSGRMQVIRVILIVSSTQAVTLKIDPSVVLATRQYVDDQIIQVKAFVDQQLAAHIAAADPHKQYAPKASPALTGTPTAPTATAGNNSTQLANTAFVRAELVAVIGGAPTTLDTLKEIATAINNDPNFSATINNALALKAPLASPAMTGTPTAPTAAQTVNNTQIATTAFVKSAIAALVASSPAALDTLNELAAALGNDPNFATTVTNALAGKQPLDSTLTDLSGKTVNGILQYLGLGKTDSPEFGGLKAPSITLRDGKIILTSSTDGTTLVFTVSGDPVAEIKAGSFFHKKIISAGEVLQSPKYIFRDGDIIFYSGPNNLVMQVGGKDVAKLTSDNFYHVKQVAAAESLKAPKVVLRNGDVNLIGGANNLVIQVGGNDIASLTPGNNFFKGKLTAETSLQVGSTCILTTDGNLTGSKWGGWLDAFMKDGMSTDGNGLWWDAFSSQLQFRVGGWNIPDAAEGAGTSVTFPKAFKNGCLMVIPVPGNGGAAQQIGIQSYSSSGAVLQKGASDNSPRSGKYLAIGY